MTFALIQNGTIVNLVIASDGDSKDPAYTWVDISAYSPVPQIGYTTTDNINFLPPGLPLDAYGGLVTFSTNGTIDTYTVSGIQYMFPAGTAREAVYVSVAIKENLQIFMAALQYNIQLTFSVQNQLQLVCMYLAALSGGLTNRAAYIAQVLTWLNNVEVYAASYVATVEALTSLPTIVSTIFNPASIPTPPTVTLLGAIAIPN